MGLGHRAYENCHGHGCSLTNCNVRLGSDADLQAMECDVRFLPKADVLRRSPPDYAHFTSSVFAQQPKRLTF